MPRPPSAYAEGYATAREADRSRADNYIAHTTIGDPVMDEIVAELAAFSPADTDRFIRAGMEEDRDGLRDAPPKLRAFFLDPPPDPPWLDRDAFGPGVRAFQRETTQVVAAFAAGVLIDGFSTLISKSFASTGRLFDKGVRRLQQNNRHMVEIFFPGGTNRYGDGWKLSVRIRFVHARVRSLLRETDEWDEGEFGVPISAAHLGYAIACFSARTIAHSRSLGASWTKEERESFCAVWRYAGHLMGIPDTILYADEEDALAIHRIGGMCEPPPGEDAMVMANALINSAPLVAGISDPGERKKLVQNLIYPISRALIGKNLADTLNFPKTSQFKSKTILFWYRTGKALDKLAGRVGIRNGNDLETVFGVSLYDEMGLTYRLPDQARAELSSQW